VRVEKIDHARYLALSSLRLADRVASVVARGQRIASCMKRCVGAQAARRACGAITHVLWLMCYKVRDASVTARDTAAESVAFTTSYAPWLELRMLARALHDAASRPLPGIMRLTSALPHAVPALATLALLAIAPIARAQSTSSSGAASATRAQLETLASGLEMAASSEHLSKSAKEAKLAEARGVRERLSSGDFYTGDRIVVTLQGDSARVDTLVVHAGRRVSFRTLPDVSLDGVLRAELKDHLTQHVSRYLRNPQITVNPLVRVSVLGEVMRPGFYPLSADVPVSDAIMAAGGPSQTADLAHTVVMRGGKQVISDPDFRGAMQNGRTLDELNLREGDEIVVGRRRERNWNLVISAVTVGLGVVTSLSLLNRR
jgi:protein involved in polysaccharide export with SLBB domain